MELTVEQDPGKEAETLRSISSSSSLADVFEEILSASKLASALGRIRRETRSQVSQSEGQTSEAVLTHKDSIPVLTRQLSNKLDRLDLFSKDNEQPTVIQTPSRNPQTSTPSNSPSPSPLSNPPRTCQTLGPFIVPPRSRSHSPNCSDISSIHGDPFSEDEQPLIDRLAALKGFDSVIKAPVIVVTGAMEAAEKEIVRRLNSLEYKMRSFTPDVLAFGQLATLQAKMDIIDALMEEISLLVLVSDLIVNSLSLLPHKTSTL